MRKGFLHKVVIVSTLVSLSGLAALGQIIPPPSPPILNVSTIAPNGDLNPYGVAFVPDHFAKGGVLNPGDILVSNFNNRANLQGTGSTIMRIQQSGGPASLFYQGPVGQVGLTAGLVVLRQGFVVVASLPSSDGTCGTGGTGGLLVIDRNGNQVQSISDNLLNGPWGLAVNEQGTHVQLFVSNVGTATITRVDLKAQQSGKFTVESLTQIASGYSGDCDASAFVVGVAGLYDSSKDVLYVASTADNAIFAIPNAGTTTTDNGTGTVIYQDNVHLHGPVGLLRAPNGDFLTANGDAPSINPDPKQPSEIVEFTPTGQFVSQFSIDPGMGAAFGIALTQASGKTFFAAVNNNTNSLELWQEP
jgi:hypothetical protein